MLQIKIIYFAIIVSHNHSTLILVQRYKQFLIIQTKKEKDEKENTMKDKKKRLAPKNRIRIKKAPNFLIIQGLSFND